MRLGYNDSSTSMHIDNSIRDIVYQNISNLTPGLHFIESKWRYMIFITSVGTNGRFYGYVPSIRSKLWNWAFYYYFIYTTDLNDWSWLTFFYWLTLIRSYLNLELWHLFLFLSSVFFTFSCFISSMWRSIIFALHKIQMNFID